MRATEFLTILRHTDSETVLPKDTNHIVYSSLTHCEHSEHSGGLSIKYVHQGIEHYTLNHYTHSVEPGEYLVANREQAFDICFRDTKPVVGLCVYFAPELMVDVMHNLSNDTATLLDTPIQSTLPVPTFAQYVYRDREHRLGQLLRQLAQTLSAQPAACFSFSDALFYELAHRLLDQQTRVRALMNRLPSSKASTREELLRRLRIAKQFIDDTYQGPITIDTIADVAALSPYHFIRSFKHVYQRSPYQYLREKRMAHAVQLLQRRQHSVSAIATQVGFSDIHAFSKAFKQRFGTAPSSYVA